METSRRGGDLKGRALQPHIVDENLEKYLSCRGPPLNSKGYQHQLRKPVTGRGAHVTSGYKSQRNSVCLGETKGSDNLGILFKSQGTSSCLQAFTLGSKGGMLAQGVSDTYRERLSCLASGQELEG